MERTCDNGTTRTPSVGAEFIATPAAPKPWSSRIWVNAPPAEWPMMIGGWSSSRTTASRCSTMAGTVTARIGCGSAFSASTSTSKPGYDGARTRKPRSS
ncbi:hypothetical protein ABN611_26210 [Kribbella sp. HUAS MG21]|uniref:Uncharacterized protein n=1 Tax=Kribbella sp. HUAS MG21 TaxID=3160966 RepID=A0AAU7T5V4_9ACTN